MSDMTTRREVEHFACPDCGRLTSVPWRAAWCLHHGSNFQAQPPHSHQSDWTRMVPVLDTVLGGLPVEADEWYVYEQRNPFSYPNDEIPGEDKRSVRIVAGPMTREQAYDDASSRPTDEGIAAHGHSFQAIPGDLRWEDER